MHRSNICSFSTISALIMRYSYLQGKNKPYIIILAIRVVNTDTDVNEELVTWLTALSTSRIDLWHSSALAARKRETVMSF